MLAEETERTKQLQKENRDMAKAIMSQSPLKKKKKRVEVWQPTEKSDDETPVLLISPPLPRDPRRVRKAITKATNEKKTPKKAKAPPEDPADGPEEEIPVPIEDDSEVASDEKKKTTKKAKKEKALT